MALLKIKALKELSASKLYCIMKCPLRGLQKIIEACLEIRGISGPCRKCLSATTFLFFKQCSTLQSVRDLRNCIAVYMAETY